MSADPLFPDNEGSLNSKKKSKKKRNSRKHKVHPEGNGDIKLTDRDFEMRVSPGQFTGGVMEQDGTGDDRGRKNTKRSSNTGELCDS